MVNRLNTVLIGQSWPARWCLLCAGLLLVVRVQAAGAEPYGEYFVRVGASWPDAGAALPRRESAPVTAQDGAGYHRQVLELEHQGGPYANTLAEPLAGLGRLHWQNGDIAEAQRLYQRALHVVRVNDGLYSERQLPILQALFESYRQSGDLRALDQRYDYYFRLYGNGEPPYTPVRLGATIEYLRWQREALRLNADADDKARLLATYKLNEQVLEGLNRLESVDLPAYRELVMSQLRNLYLIQGRYAPRTESRATVANPSFATSWGDEDFDLKKLELLQRKALPTGRALLQQLIARTPPDAAVELARTYLEQADWNQWNGRTDEALDDYGQVVKLLRDAGQEQLLRQWLGRPVELPDNGAFWQPSPEASGKQTLAVAARYDVSAEGRVVDIHETSVTPPRAGVDEEQAERNERLAYKLRRHLKQTRFRPRFANGKAEAATRVERVYQLIH